MTNHEDARMLAAIREGSIRAFEQLYEKYRLSVYRTALGITRDPSAAEDIVQECFLRVHAHIDSLDGSAGLAPWLYRVTINLSYNWLERNKRSVSLAERLLGALSLRTSLQTMAERSETVDVLAGAMEEISPEHRTVLVLHYLNELSIEEIAAILDCPPGTVKSRLFYARRKLREVLSRRGIADRGVLA